MAETFFLVENNLDVVFTSFVFFFGFYFLREGCSQKKMKYEKIVSEDLNSQEKEDISNGSDLILNNIEEQQGKGQKKQEDEDKKDEIMRDLQAKEKEEQNKIEIKEQKIEKVFEEKTKKEVEVENLIMKNETELQGECSPSVVFSKIQPIVSTFLHEEEKEKSSVEIDIQANIDCSNLEISLEDEKEFLTIYENENSLMMDNIGVETCAIIYDHKEEMKDEEAEVVAPITTIFLEEEEQKLEEITDKDDHLIKNHEISVDEVGNDNKNEDDESSIPCINLNEELKDEEDLNRDISHQPVLKNETPPITPPREEEKTVKITKRNSSLFRTFSQFTSKLFNSKNEADNSMKEFNKVGDEVSEQKEEWIVLDKDSIENDIANFCLENETLSSSLSMQKKNL